MDVEVEVEYDYDAELPDELTIRVGDVIKNVKQMSGGWWEGQLNAKKGLFPENFVKVISQSTFVFSQNLNFPPFLYVYVPVSQSAFCFFFKVVKGKRISKDLEDVDDKTTKVPLRKEQAGKRCKVLFSYRPTHEDELELKLDEVLDFMGEVEDGWWKGRAPNGSVGVFPSNFVEIINKPDVSTAASGNNNKNNNNHNGSNKNNSDSGKF